MYTIFAKTDEVCNELPKLNKWVNTIYKKFIKEEVNLEEVEILFSYGLFVPKGDKADYYSKQYDMLFSDRLDLEMSKLRVDVMIKVGKFSMVNRVDDNMIPAVIKQIVTELTKVKMTLECEQTENEKVKASIPEIDSSIVSMRVVNEAGDAIVGSDSLEEEFDIDSILDKVSVGGVESLSVTEKEFLDKISKT